MRIAVIFVGVDETKGDAVQRHYRERPEDRYASQTLFVTFVAPVGRKIVIWKAFH
jgi:hypothetical protein